MMSGRWPTVPGHWPPYEIADTLAGPSTEIVPLSSSPLIRSRVPAPAAWFLALLALGLPRLAAGGGAPVPDGAPGATPPSAGLVASAGPEPAAAVATSEPAPVPAPDPLAAIPSPEELERRGAVIGKILFDAQDIFDLTRPGENNVLFRAANRLHPVTRERTLAKLLILRPGERYDRRRIAENERLLRGERFLYDAQIVPVAWDGERVDLEVRTRDVWSLRVGASVKHAGGDTTTHFELQDSNFLGLGKSIEVARNQDIERTSYILGYEDRNVAGTHTKVDLAYVDSSDGLLYEAIIDRPFFSLDSRWAAGLKAVHEEKITALYRLDRRITRFAHERDFFRLYGGLSAGLTGRRTVRYSAGYTWDDNRFAQLPGRNFPIPPDRRLSYPWLAMGLLQDGFETTRNLDQISRTEDLNLGLGARFQLGWADPAFGADRQALVGEGEVSGGLRPRPNLLLLYEARGDGRWEREQGLRGVLLSTSGRLYWRNFGNHNLVVGLSGALAHYLDAEKQLTLGGDNGLRGYPHAYQDGNRRFLVSIEQRFYRAKEYFHLARIGAAIFFDAGRCWFTGEDYPANLGLLKDVGFGLRISSSRSASATMIHLDVAFPLDARRNIDRVQFLVTAAETF